MIASLYLWRTAVKLPLAVSPDRHGQQGRGRALPNVGAMVEFLIARRDAITALVGFGLVMSVYLRTMMSGVAFMDIGEYQSVTYVLGIAHPTGVPLYVMMGKLFGTLLPFGRWAWRMNLFSAVCAASAATLLIWLALRYEVTPLIALAAGLTFAFALNTWMDAVAADPHPMTMLIAALLWMAALRWGQSGARRWLWILALGCGLGLGGAAILSTELPALVIYALIARPRDFLRPKNAVVAGLLGIGGVLLIYSYLPLRSMMNPPMNYARTDTWAGFRHVALGGQVASLPDFARMLGWHNFVEHLRQTVGWYDQWLTPHGTLAVGLLALLGLIRLGLRDWRFGVAAAIGIGLPVYVASVVPIVVISRYFLIPDWLLMFVAALGAQTLLIDPLRHLTYGAFRLSFVLVIAAATLAFPYDLVATNWEHANQHGYDEGTVLAHEVLAAVKPNAVIFSWWGPSAALWYGRYVEGLRPDVEIIDDSRLSVLGWSDATEGMYQFYGKRPIYTVPFWDEHQRYQRRFQFRRVRDLSVFAQAMYEVTGEVDPPPDRYP